MGLDPSLNCSGFGNGIPFAQVPVLTLTATSTMIQAKSTSAEAPPTPAEPAPSIPVVSETSNPLVTVTQGRSVKPVDTSVPYPGSTLPIKSGTAVTTATDSGYNSVPLTNTALPAASASVSIFGSLVTYLTPSNTIEATAYPSASNGVAPTVVENSQSEYIVGLQTLSPGGSDIIVTGKTISLASFGSELVVGGSTVVLHPSLGLTTVTAPVAKVTEIPATLAITLDGATITRDSLSGYIIDGQTLVPGGSTLTISNTILPLAESSTALVLRSSTIAIPLVPNYPVVPIISFEGLIVTANSQSVFIVGPQTLVPGGPAITASGEILFLASSAADLIVISSPAHTPGSSTLGLADIIMSALDGESSTTTDVLETASTNIPSGSQGAVPFTGSAKRQKRRTWWSYLILGLCMVLQILS